MATVIPDRFALTLRNLNSSQLNGTTYVHGTSLGANGDGLYALINDMISNLSSIKASIKTEEKNIITDMESKIVQGTNANEGTALGGSPACTAATACETTSGARGDTFGSSLASLNPAVFKGGSKNYSEAAVFGVLRGAGQMIKDLKAGTVTDFTATTYDGMNLKV